MSRYAQGGDLTRFDTGGLHSQNPLGGIPIGNNNSVEENETKQNNFVYSNRIFLDENSVSQYNLPKSLIGKSVADATKFIDNKFKGRNDKISQSTKDSMLSKIAEAQEFMKPQEPEMEQQNYSETPDGMSQMAFGGYRKQMFGGGLTINTSDNALESTKLGTTDNTSSGTGVSSTAGAIGTAVGDSLASLPSSALDKKYTFNPKLKGQDQAYDSATKAVASVFPIAGLIFGAKKGLLAAGEAVGGEKGRDVSTGLFDPSAGQREVLQSKDSTQFEKGLSLAAPFISGVIAGKSRERAENRYLAKNAQTYNNQFSDQYALGGEIDPPKKDIRRNGDTLILSPIKEFNQKLSRSIPTSDNITIPKIDDPAVAQATKNYVNWYKDPATLKKFEKNTGYNKKRLLDLTNYGANVPIKQTSAANPLFGQDSQAEFQGYETSAPQEQIVYQKGVDGGVIQHERVHAGGQDVILGSALKRVLGSPFEQKTKNAPNVVKRYMNTPEESYGNFHQLRIKLGMKPGETINQKDLEQRIKDKGLESENFYQTYDNDKITKAINTIASNNSKDNINYAAYGGKLKQMADGGDYYENLKLNARNQDPNGLQNFLKPASATTPYTIGTQPIVDISNANRITTPGPSNLDMLEYNASKVGNYINNNAGNIARYAPIAANAYQLAKLKKPNGIRLSRLDNRYKPSYVDMAQQQNIVNQELNNTNSAIQQSGASQGVVRNAILGSQLNKTKALSNAYMNAEAQNRQQEAVAQQFNLGVDQTNLQQSNSELDINDRNSAAYRNEKSKYISAIGNDIGEVGKEEIYKKIAKTTTGYSWLGEYQKTNPNATPAEIKAAAEKAGVLTDSTSKKALGGYLLKNKGK